MALLGLCVWGAAAALRLTWRDLYVFGALPKGQSALSAAAERSDVDQLKSLIASGTNVNEAGVLGVTALMLAVTVGNTECAELLIEAGADVNARAGAARGNTALMGAAAIGNLECVRTLLIAGADVNAQNDTGSSPVMAAVCGGAMGADGELLPCTGGGTFVEPVQCCHAQCIDILVRAGADIELQDVDGHTALMGAVHGAHLDCVRTLIANGALVNARNAVGITALGMLLGKEKLVGYSAVITVLKEAGAAS